MIHSSPLEPLPPVRRDERKDWTRAWRKSRLAARLVFRLRGTGSLPESRRTLARHLAGDAEVTNRLIHQALGCLELHYGSRSP